MTGAFVKQKFDALEAMTGCEQANKYYIYAMKPGGGRKGS